MISNEIREKFQDIVRGTRLQGAAGHCSTVRNLLVESFGAGSTVKSEFESRAIIKEEQAHFLRSWAKEAGLWLPTLPPGSEYLTRGGESKVYLASDGLNASFNGPQGLCIDDNGVLYMTTFNYDTNGGNKIRKITIQ